MSPRHAAPVRRGRRGVVAALGLVVLLVVALVVVLSRGTSAPSAASPGTPRATYPGPDGVVASWVVAENRRPGTTAWQIHTPPGPTTIAGYANRVQARVGERVTLYVDTTAATFRVDAYRMGYYQGKGARLVWQSPTTPGSRQPVCPVTPGINMVLCHWRSSLSFTVTRDWVQGEYLLKLVSPSDGASYVPLTIWDPASRATYVVMAGVLTDQVFNAYGGYDLYQGATACAPGIYPCSSRSRVVSFDRPYASGDGAGGYLGLLYPLTRFMEQHGLDVTYWTDVTLATHGALLSRHAVLISPGHDEEWSLSMRQAALRARNEGVNLIFFGASPILRKVRLQPSPLGANREIVNYRDPQQDPLYARDPAQVSQNWWGQPPANLPASTLVGGEYIGFNNAQSFPLVVSAPSSWLFRGTGLARGAHIPDVLSTDFQMYNPLRAGNPPHVQILAHSPVTGVLTPGAHFADTTYYTMPHGGAGVFESGANSWIASLQACPPSTPSCPARLMRLLTGNVLRVFGQGPVGRRYPS